MKIQDKIMFNNKASLDKYSALLGYATLARYIYIYIYSSLCFIIVKKGFLKN